MTMTVEYIIENELCTAQIADTSFAGLGAAERRFMQWKTWTTFYDEYKIWCSSNARIEASKSTFRRGCASWTKYVGFRKTSQHSRF